MEYKLFDTQVQSEIDIVIIDILIIFNVVQ